MEAKHKKLYIAIFWIYSAFMLYLLFNRTGGIEGMDYWDQIRTHLNPIPFHTIRLFLKVLHNQTYSSAAFINLGGNVIMFIPLGFLLPQVFPRLRKFWRTILATALIITAVEVTQLFTLLGYCDIDDLILNLIGSLMGYVIYIYQSKPPAKPEA